MHPLDILRDDHREIKGRIAAFEVRLDAAVRRSLPGTVVASFAADLAFLRGDLLRHFGREDRALLPALERKLGRYGDSMVDLLAQEHAELRRAVGKFSEAVAVTEGAEDGGGLEEVNRHGLFLVQVLQDHVRKEELAFFPRALEVLTAEDWEAVALVLAAER